MRSFWNRIRWADVAVGAVVWGLFVGELMVLDELFPSTRPGCVESSPFSCWDLRAPFFALLSLPLWYVVWALALRPCPWPLRWVTPLAVSFTAYRFAGVAHWHAPVMSQVTLVICFLVTATLMSAANAVADADARAESVDREQSRSDQQ